MRRFFRKAFVLSLLTSGVLSPIAFQLLAIEGPEALREWSVVSPDSAHPSWAERGDSEARVQYPAVITSCVLWMLFALITSLVILIHGLECDCGTIADQDETQTNKAALPEAQQSPLYDMNRERRLMNEERRLRVSAAKEPQEESQKPANQNQKEEADAQSSAVDSSQSDR